MAKKAVQQEKPMTLNSGSLCEFMEGFPTPTGSLEDSFLYLKGEITGSVILFDKNNLDPKGGIQDPNIGIIDLKNQGESQLREIDPFRELVRHFIQSIDGIYIGGHANSIKAQIIEELDK